MPSWRFAHHLRRTCYGHATALTMDAVGASSSSSAARANMSARTGRPTPYGDLSLAIPVYGTQVAGGTRFRTVGHRSGYRGTRIPALGRALRSKLVIPACSSLIVGSPHDCENFFVL